MDVPKQFWADAISTAIFFINKMPSSVLNWVTPYHQLFPNKPLFPIDSKVFECTCFVLDIRPQVSKLDPKSLKYIFVGYSRVQKGYACYCPTLQRYFVSTDVTIFETTPFSFSSPFTSQGEGDDILMYTISPPVPPAPLAPSAPTSTPVPIKPPITQVYSQHLNPPVSSPTPAASPSDSVQNDDLPIALHKGEHQCASPISSFVFYNHL